MRENQLLYKYIKLKISFFRSIIQYTFSNSFILMKIILHCSRMSDTPSPKSEQLGNFLYLSAGSASRPRRITADTASPASTFALYSRVVNHPIRQKRQSIARSVRRKLHKLEIAGDEALKKKCAISIFSRKPQTRTILYIVRAKVVRMRSPHCCRKLGFTFITTPSRFTQ